MEIIELKDISFNYSSDVGEEDFAIRNLNLTIEESDFISILGPNGSGKSTLLKIIANIFHPNSGRVSLFGQNYKSIKRSNFAKSIAFVPQNNSTNFPFSIFEIVMMGRSPYLNYMGLEKQRDHEIVSEALNLLEIYPLRNKGINEVSGGEAQRALIARALVQDPKILLLDEPNAHLDIKHQLHIYEILKKMNSENNLTIITVSHDMNLSNYYSSRAILMRDGRILFDAAPKLILTKSNIKEIFGVESKIFETEDEKTFISLIH